VNLAEPGQVVESGGGVRDVRDEDARALFEKAPRIGEAEARGAARDDPHAILELHV
jgi:hypothetical protein